METKGFTIISRGDRTVGVFPEEWRLSGEFHFNDLNEKLEFMESLRVCFELYVDDVMVYDSNDLELERVRFDVGII